MSGQTGIENARARTLEEKTAEQERNEAWAVIQQFRAILSRPGKRIDACKRVLENYDADMGLVTVRLRARDGQYNPQAAVVETFGGRS